MAEKEFTNNFKKAFLLLLEKAVSQFAATLGKEQEILMYLADILIETYVSESMVLRVQKLSGIRGADAVKEQVNMMQVYVNDAADKIYRAGKNVINSFLVDEERQSAMATLQALTTTEAINTMAARRNIASKIIAENKYCF